MQQSFSHSHGHLNGNKGSPSSWDNGPAVMLESEESSPIPASIAEGMKVIIADMKKNGQIPADADEQMIMKSMHNEMMREREQMIQKGAFVASAQPLSGGQQAVTPMVESFGTQDSLISIVKKFGSMGHGQEGGQCTHRTPNNNPMQEVIRATVQTIQHNPSAIHDIDENGDSVLHHIASVGQDKVVGLLLANGANPNLLNNSGQTPIHYAAKGGHILVIQLLAEQGADISHRDKSGWNALHHAASGLGTYCPHTLHYLTFCGGLSYADVTDDGSSLLHIIARTKKENNRYMLPILLTKKEIDVFLVDNNGSSAMHYAVEQIQPNMCYQIANVAGAKICLVANKDGKTALEIARDLTPLEGFLLSQEIENWLNRGSNTKPCESTPMEYQKKKFLPTILLLSFMLVSRLLTPSSQGWICLLGMLVFQLLVFLPRHRIDQITRLPSPARFAAAMSTLTIFSLILVISIIPTVAYARPLTSLVLSLSVPSVALLLIRLVLTDPGYTNESKRKDSGEFYTMKDLVCTFKKPGIWCAACQLIPTKPTKHCKLCNRCVYWMDHHCMYTMSCVGYNNYYTFIWYNIFLVTLQICSFFLLPEYMSIVYKKESIFDRIADLFNYEGYVFVMYCGMAQFFFFSLHMLFNNLSNIANGYTTFFKPRDAQQVSGLSICDKMRNIFNFLLFGKTLTKDPYFNL